MKHLENCINAGQLSPTGFVPVWLSELGLEGIDSTNNKAQLVRITYEETADILRLLAGWANAMEDPLTGKEKLSKL
jgi:hypothetical protein